MTREEAFKAMKDGKRISHYNFGRNEYYELKHKINSNEIVAEDGVCHTEVFWQKGWRADGWYEYTPKGE